MNLTKLIETLNCSGYTDRAIARDVGLNVRTFRKWVARDQTPNNKSMKKIEEMIEIMSRTPTLPRHPSYGYATPDQIKRLEQIGMGPERDQILKQIAKQNETSGKTRF